MTTYIEYRDSIENGDILFFYKGKRLLSKVIQTVTQGPYCHNAIAFNLDIPGSDSKRVFVVEEHGGGQRIVTLSSCVSHYHGFSLIKNPLSWNQYGPDLIGQSGYIPYSYLDLVSITLKEKLGINISDHKGEVCSEMVARVLIDNGVKLDSSLVSPNKLYNQLIALGCETKFIQF